ncbi:transposase [Streptomyces sp. G-G2]|uniref:transposase n=1 Tax=Streptomyces sp. G-G2 TaxID=3046201 RepID=UPI0024B8BCD6|nr:transposase [Streptomyces sp. G-G2]MDJ0383497.1 transposase [Streptomyces sp. G-G2]
MNEADDLDDRQWAAVRALIPRCGPSGPDYRTIVNGILWHQAGGRRWHDLPSRYGPWHRCAERLRLWSSDGTWQQILGRLSSSHLAEGTDKPEAGAAGRTEMTRNTSDWNTPWRV